MNRSRNLLRDLMLFGVAFACLAFCVSYQHHNYKKWVVPSGKYIQTVNLPNAQIIKVAALGYDNLYADFLTLRAIQSYGAAWDTTSGDVQPIYNYFDILTTLDPHFVDVYELGHLVMADAHTAYEMGLELLRKGIRYNPTNWRLPYLGVYTSLYDMKQPKRSHEFLRVLKRIPSTPEYVLRMEEFIERQSGQYHAAFDVNLGYYLRYIDFKMDVEESVTLSKFRVILDGWYRLELARSAEAYLKKNGRHPASIEEMLLDPVSIPRFTAPTLETIEARIQAVIDKGERLEPHRDDIREGSMVEIAGLPPNPFGTWYYLSKDMQDDVVGRRLPETATLEERFGYFQGAQEVFGRLDSISLGIQQAIQSKTHDNGDPPHPEEIVEYLREDGFGGHWVYRRDPLRIFSTTQKRIIERNDPRLGLHGLIGNFPKRPYVFDPSQPPYLTTVPSIWDFPDDIEWGLCKGLTPGILFEKQPEELQRKARSEGIDYLDCDENVQLPVEPEK